jgi:hypothetical protein
MLNLDTIIGIVLGVPLGILIGYRWRDHISQRRRDHTWPSAPSANDAQQWSEKEKIRPATAPASVGCRPDFLLTKAIDPARSDYFLCAGKKAQ